MLEIGLPLFSDAQRRASAAHSAARLKAVEAQWTIRAVRSDVLNAEAVLNSLEQRLATARSLLKEGKQQLPSTGAMIGSPRDRIALDQLRERTKFELEQLELMLEEARVQLQETLGHP